MTDKELEQIYNEAYRAVYWTAMGFLKNEADAEDIVQDTFVALIESYDSIRDKSKVISWLKKTAANKCLDRIKLAKTDNMDEEFFDSVEAVPEDFLPDSIIESEDARRIVMDIINNKLSDDIRRTLILFYFDDMSTKEIAEVLGIPQGTVSWRLNFAKKTIKREVEKYENENKTKLFGMALPFLSKLFIKEAEQVPFKAMPAKLVSLSASAQASGKGANIKASTEAIRKGTDIMKTKILIGSIAAVVAVGSTAGIIIGVISKRSDTKPHKTDDVVIEDVDERQDDTVDVSDVSYNTEFSASDIEPGMTGFCAVSKLSTPYGDYYINETVGEVVDQFSSNDAFRIVIQDDKDNEYTVDDLDTVVTTYIIAVLVYHDDERICHFEASRVKETAIRDCRITDIFIESGTTHVYLNNSVIEIGKTTLDEVVGLLGEYTRTSSDELSHTYRYAYNNYELTDYAVSIDNDNVVDMIFIHK